MKRGRQKIVSDKRPKTQTQTVGYRSFRLSKRIRRDNSGLPGSWRLLGRTYRTLIKHWRLLGGITLVYGVLYWVFVRVAPNVNLEDYKQLINGIGGDNLSGISRTATLAAIAIGTSGVGANANRFLYGYALLIIVSLAIIWALRQIFADKPKKVTIRDAFYNGMAPLISYVIIASLILLQLIPFIVGGWLYSVALANHITVNGAENLFFAIFWGILSLLSGYWLANSLMSLYAVTIPGMYPLNALRGMAKAVEHRRLLVLRRIIFLPLILFAIFMLVFLFVIAVKASVALVFLDLAIIVAPVIVHTYMYLLYRSLL